MELESGIYRYGQYYIIEFDKKTKCYNGYIDKKYCKFSTGKGSVPDLNEISSALEEEIEWYTECKRQGKFIPQDECITNKYIVVFKSETYILARYTADGIIKWEDWVVPIIEYLKEDISVKKVKPGSSSDTLSIKRLAHLINQQDQ